MNDKVKPAHLSRSAYIYVRQSTASQVINNTESQRLQYNLQERAQQLGWPSSLINVIDQDLGRTASDVTFRLGFEQILRNYSPPQLISSQEFPIRKHARLAQST